jgi:hypothetical protein
MPEQVDFDWTYPLSPLATFRMLTRLDHLEAKAQYLGHERHQVRELRERGGVFRSITERQVDTKLPTWAPRLFTPRNMIRQTQLWAPPEWDGARAYDADVEVSGVPVRVSGSGALVPAGYSDTRYRISLTVISRARFIGRRVEGVVAGALRETVEGEHEFRLLWMSQHGQNRHHFST